MPRRKKQSQRKAWQPLEIGPPDPAYVARRERVMREVGVEDVEPVLAVGVNDVYQVIVTRAVNGLRHLSIHRHDRKAMRDWRHLQQIKSEVLGANRMAVEVFPPDDLLFDTSNEYHLWELPAEMIEQIGVRDVRLIFQAGEANKARVAGHGRARQRPIQPGLTVYEEGEQ